jgi:hypothetical protein
MRCDELGFEVLVGRALGSQVSWSLAGLLQMVGWLPHVPRGYWLSMQGRRHTVAGFPAYCIRVMRVSTRVVCMWVWIVESEFIVAGINGRWWGRWQRGIVKVDIAFDPNIEHNTLGPRVNQDLPRELGFLNVQTEGDCRKFETC